MSEAGDRLKEARIRAGYSSAQMAAQAMGISPATYAQHENGTRGYPASKAERYGRFFRVAPEWLLYGKTQGLSSTPLGPQLRIIGEVAAGVFREAWRRDGEHQEQFTGRGDITTPTSKRFGLAVIGDSMNLVYPSGTVLECVEFEGQEIVDGRRVIVQRTKLDGTVEATVKEVARDAQGTIWLVPRSSNPSFQAFRADQPDSPDIASVELIGLVVGSYRPE